ncbi:hypothetical protein DSO57_1010555 [Entomophthora muscae]|uniref:Uncharacterized protein n=1 Tax=Entomophthora muscae TaxID=34485 RepID=A0ACC2SVN1_9FUNG|nr:hypothetical protein DSO57_1010555 [Entomophthora muscae]
MSLYGDLPPPSSSKDGSLNESEGEISKSNSGGGTISLPPSIGKAPLTNKSSLTTPHFTPSTILRKSNPASGPKFTSFRRPPVFKPTISVNPSEPTLSKAKQQVTAYQPPIIEPLKTTEKVTSNVQDEYDPAYPNDFAKMQRLREEAQLKQSLHFNSCSRSPSPRSNNSYNGSPRYSSGSQSPDRVPNRIFSAVPPPPSLVSSGSTQAPTIPLAQSGEEAYLRRLQLSQTSKPIQSGEEAYLRRLQLSKATELVQSVVKSEPNAGSSILLLMNMVSREDADDQLEEEVTNECIKFGQVIKCFVYVAPPEIPEQHSVRIFVEFSSPESALEAKHSLHGRLFAGRNIQAEIFDQARFRRFDFAARPDELERKF